MKNFRKNVAILLTVCMLIASIPFTVAAEGFSFEILEESSISVGEIPGLILGTIEDQDGILLDDDRIVSVDAVRNSSSSTHLFSMTAAGVTGLLTTHGVNGKSFTGGVMDGAISEGLLIEGTLTQTNRLATRVGACYLDQHTANFVSVVNTTFSSGTFSQGWWVKTTVNFPNTRTHFGHITNTGNAGSVSGTLDFYVSKKP